MGTAHPTIIKSDSYIKISLSTDTFLKVLGIRAAKEQAMTEEEIKVLKGHGRGVVSLWTNKLRLNHRRADNSTSYANKRRHMLMMSS